MPSFNDFIVFVDESGDHGIASLDPTYPVFVLAFCIFEKRIYTEKIVPPILEFKFQYFGHDQIILHEHEIRKAKGLFKILFDKDTRNNFMQDLSLLVEQSPFTLIASVIRKDQYKRRHTAPDNPYHLAMGFGLERIFLYLTGLGCRTEKTFLLFEGRGKKEDTELELEFRRACSSNITGKPLPFEIVIVNKLSNSAGLQLADLIARPIGIKILRPQQPNRTHKIIWEKFRRDANGKIEGWGLKVFP